jgi:Cu/Ag efflux pump CusA
MDAQPSPARSLAIGDAVAIAEQNSPVLEQSQAQIEAAQGRGVRADIAVKIFDDDLDTLIAKAQQVAKVATSIRGTQDTRVDRVGGQQYLTIDIDRGAIARYGHVVPAVGYSN